MNTDDQGGDAPIDITDIAQLQEQVGKLLERVNADRQLALAAATNPLLALEELGFRVTPDVQREIARRSRYTRRQLVQIDASWPVLLKQAPDFPRDIDLLSAAQIRRVLHATLRIPDERIPRDLAMPPRPAPDPLEPLRDAHPALPALLDLREVERSALQFATPELYRKVRSGKLNLPVKAVAGKLAGRGPQAAGGSRG